MAFQIRNFILYKFIETKSFSRCIISEVMEVFCIEVNIFPKKKFRKFQFSTAILKIQKQTIYRWKALRFLYKKFVHECFVQVTVLFGNDWEEWKCEKMHSRLYLKWSAFFALHSKLAKIIIELHLNLFSIKFKKYRVGNWNWLVGIK